MNNNELIISENKTNNKSDYLIIFELENKVYGINIKNVLEVINLPEIEIPMQTPKGVIGMFNYNGVMINAVDVCPFFGFNTNNFSVNDKLIILTIEDKCFAVHARNIINIIQTEYENLQPLPYGNQDSFISQIYKLNEETINIINLEALTAEIYNTNPQINTVDYSSVFPQEEKDKEILKQRSQNNKIINDNYSFPINMQEIKQYLLFTLGEHNYYLDLKYIKEFISIKRLNITKLPYTEKYIKGIINSRGDFLVVIDLKSFLNMEETEIKPTSKLIVTEGKNFNIAFLVDDIKYIKNLKDIEKTSLYSGNSKYTSVEFSENNELYSILNYEKIINDERIYIDIN